MKLNLTDEERGKSLDWCRDFIDHNCIYRTPEGEGMLTSPSGGLHTWQFYTQVATLDQEFSVHMARLFWDHFIDGYTANPFQICGCETGGVPMLVPLQRIAFAGGLAINVFSIKKEPKKYGLKNWIEGRIIENLPILLVDDVVASSRTLEAQANRLVDMGFTLYPETFAVLSCKKKRPDDIKVGDLTLPVTVFYGSDAFAHTWQRYVAKYGKDPVFYGTVV